MSELPDSGVGSQVLGFEAQPQSLEAVYGRGQQFERIAHGTRGRENDHVLELLPAKGFPYPFFHPVEHEGDAAPAHHGVQVFRFYHQVGEVGRYACHVRCKQNVDEFRQGRTVYQELVALL